MLADRTEALLTNAQPDVQKGPIEDPRVAWSPSKWSVGRQWSMINGRARIGAWGAEVGRPARKCASSGLLGLPDADCLRCKIGGVPIRTRRATRAHPKQNKVPKWASGCPAPSNRRPPSAKKSHLPCQHPPASTTGKERQAHPTESQHPFLLRLQHCCRHQLRACFRMLHEL